ncbi:MAG: glycoside hydrolase family 3 N-terminal domain-containing protein [Verrucomicrobiota bacterium]
MSSKFSIEISDTARARANKLNFEELVRELCCPNYFDHTDRDQYVACGSVFFHPAAKETHREMIDRYNELCESPPLVATDLEEGPGAMIKGATEFPSYYGCSRKGPERLGYEMGRIAALEGREVGYNWTFAPCVDILSNPDTPTTSYRSAGEELERVVAMGKAYSKGCQDFGMIATAKHFPGDGFGVYDQHLTTPEIPLTLDAWRESSGRSFKEVIDGGVMSVMPGHLSFPAYDEPDDRGIYPPATLSSKLMGDLLRGELGFDGLIVSDAVGMGGFCGYRNYYDACAVFWECGGDVLLFAHPDDVFISEMEKRIQNGLLKTETMVERATRLISLKEQIGLLGGSETPFTKGSGPIDLERHQSVANEVIESSVEIVRDRQGILPIANVSSKKALHVVLPVESYQDLSLMKAFTSKLQERFEAVDEMVDPGNHAIWNALDEYDVIVCSLANNYNFGTNAIRFHGPVARNLMKGWMHMGTPAVFVSHYHPLTHLEYEAVMDTVIRTCGTIEGSLDPLVRRIVG